MNTTALNVEPLTTGFAPRAHTASALRSLMQMWEQETLTDEEEGETELMVMLSGMVGGHAIRLDDE